MRIIENCEVCDGNELVPVVDLGAQPMCDDLVPIGNAARPEAYPLQLVACPRCLTVHQRFQVAKRLLFPPTYHYRSRLTQDVLNGMQALVDDVEAMVGSLRGKQVLDVGCNDGSLLSMFAAKGARTAGIEPTGAAEDAKQHVDFVLDTFFDADAVDRYLAACPPPDVIAFTNVFAHIEDLNGLLANLKRIMHPGTKLVIENHYLGSVLERNQFDTFYHEHPRTYSRRAFAFIAEKLGRRIEAVSFPKRYGGNIRVVIGDGPVASGQGEPQEDVLMDALLRLPPLVERKREEVRALLERLAREHGPLPAKAFPGRASILIHAFGITQAHIDATYERSSSPKVGFYVPGTTIEIRDEAEFFRERKQAPVMINLAWHIHDEVTRYMRGHGYGGQLVPIFS